MEYIAHRSEDQRDQSVLDHLTGTAALCSRFAAPFGAAGLGAFTSMAHDIGKYSEGFQKRIRGGDRVDHSTAGAFECAQRNHIVAAFCVAGHHGGLPDGGIPDDDPDKPTFFGRLNRAAEGRLLPYGAWKQEVTLPQAKQPPFGGKHGQLDAFFFTRMLYSCLVDADFLDTEQFMAGEAPPRGCAVSMETLFQRLEAHTAQWFPPESEVNRLRCEILQQCIEQGGAQTPGLYTLTVPTGGGKTTASLAFALRHACAHGKRRIVYVIPYTSIIEQTADTFRKILGADVVLEHHSNFIYETDEKGDATPEAQRLMRATENWDMPVVVTTAVQFFESLYSFRSSQCRKLHNLADSVIIFDEVQMLPLPYLRPCVSAIAQLVARYGVTALLCTATQPALSPLFQEFLPGVPIPELCDASIPRDPVFRRVRFEQAGRLSWAELAGRLLESEQVLCIVNSRKNAQQVYQSIHGEGAFHLSTLMTPNHRKAVLTTIRKRLDDRLPCRVVSTSLIEAGVDVDFPRVFRETAGLDSILQAAGRCNRNGKNPASESVVTVFQGETAPPELFSAAIAAGCEVMEEYADISDPAAIESYFQKYLKLKGARALDTKNILPTIQTERFPFRTVAKKFRLIEQDTRTVYIPLGDGAPLVQRLRDGERSRELFRDLGQFGVSVYSNHFNQLCANGLLEPVGTDSAILLNLSVYSEETGLPLTVEANFII